MAMTHDYLDFLNERIDIAPTNSEEELQAAQIISDLMAQHNVEPAIEDFEAPIAPSLAPTVLAIAMLVGMLLAGVTPFPLNFIGFLLAIVPAVLSVMRVFGREVSFTFGPSAQSQNVVAVHRAEGPLVTKGSRTIVLVAHYDTPRENPLLTTPVAPYLTMLAKLSHPCSFVAAACAFLQLMGFLPLPFRIVVLLVGIVACAPAMVLAVGSIMERTAPCTEGANDNKAAVAALLGVLENVRPSGVEPQAREFERSVEEEPANEAEAVEEAAAPDTEAEAASAVSADEAVELEPASQPELPLGVRHGEEVLRSLAILPEECEIAYVAPAPQPAPVAPQAEKDEDAEAQPAVSSTSTIPLDAAALEQAAASDDSDAAATAADLPTDRFSIVMEDGGESVGPQDEAGLTVVAEDDPDATQAVPVQRPDAPDDPEWGKTSFRPQLSSVARRASLFDLPDPSEGEADPFDTGAGAPVTQAASDQLSDDPLAPATQPDGPETISTISASDLEEAQPKKFGLFDKLRGFVHRAPANDDESDDEGYEDDENGSWRGGAATRSGLRLVEGEGEADAEGEEAPSEEDLRDAVLQLGDDALIAHDIWFVALGGSSLDHAGMRSFLARHRSEVRGCFVVNLDCIGAGALTALKNEGLELTRRGDRRIYRLLSGVAADLHTELALEPHDWADTDATPAMRRSLRGLTLMGLDANGLPALSKTADDVAENVSGDQAATVAAMVTEMIRRS